MNRKEEHYKQLKLSAYRPPEKIESERSRSETPPCVCGAPGTNHHMNGKTGASNNFHHPSCSTRAQTTCAAELTTADSRSS